MSVTLNSEVRETRETETEIGWREGEEIVIGGDNQELMKSLRYGTKAIMIRVEGEGIFEPRLPLPFLLKLIRIELRDYLKSHIEKQLKPSLR